MVYYPCKNDSTRVPLEHSYPLLSVGLAAGLGAGWVLRRLVRGWPFVGSVVRPLLVAVFVGSIAGPFGWLQRDYRLDGSGAWSIGLAAGWGMGVGLTLWVAECGWRMVCRVGQDAAEPGAAADPAACRLLGL